MYLIPEGKQQIIGFIKGVIALYEYGNGKIDEDKQLTFTAIEINEKVKVEFSYVSSIKEYKGDDPTKGEDEYRYSSTHFTWLKSENHVTLTKYIDEAIGEIDELKIDYDNEPPEE